MLFTSVPVDPAIGIIKDLLEKDPNLKERTVMSVWDIVFLLEFFLKNTYFSFQGQFYEQVEGTAMGLPIHPIAAKLYMEYFGKKALSTASHPPQVMEPVYGDTFVIQKEENKQNSYNTSTVLTQPYNLQWKATRKMVSSPSWIPL